MVSQTSSVSTSNSAARGTPVNPPRSLVEILNDGNPQEVTKALAQLAEHDFHLDLSAIRLNAEGLKAVCSVVGNPLAAVHFDKVTWGFVPDSDFDQVLNCLPYTSAQIFDISKLKSETPGNTYFGPISVKFREFDTILKICESSGPFRVGLVLDSEGKKDSRDRVDQLRQQKINVSDIWRRTLLHKINSVGPGCLPNSWHSNSDIDLHFEVGEDTQVLHNSGMYVLVNSMNTEQMTFAYASPNPVKDRLVLGRVESLVEFFDIEPFRLPKCLDLSHVRICAKESDEGSFLTDQHANELVKLIEPEFNGKLSLQVLHVDVSGMSEEAVQSLQEVCSQAGVRLEITRQQISQALHGPVVAAPREQGVSTRPVEAVKDPGVYSADDCPRDLSVDVDAKLSDEFNQACERDEAWRIAERLEESPEITTKLSLVVQEKLKGYATQLIDTGGTLMKEYGTTILRRLGTAVPVANTGHGEPARLVSTADGGSVISVVAVDDILSSKFADACEKGHAMWIAHQLEQTPQMIAKLEPNVVLKLRNYANGLVNGYGSMYQELGAIILRRLPDK